VAGLTFVLYLLTGGYSYQSIDTDAASTPVWALVRTGSLDLMASPGLLAPDLLTNEWYVETANGLLSNRFPGVIAYSLPFYGVAEALGIGSRWGPGVVAAATVTAAAVGVMVSLLAALGMSRRVCVGASLFFGLGTATWAVSADAQWPHGIDQLLVVVGLRLMVAGRSASAGLVLGLLCFVRPQLAPAVLVIGLAWAWWDGRWVRLLRFGPPALLGLALVVVYNGLVFGVWSFDHGYYEYGGLQGVSAAGLAAALAATVVGPSRGLLLMYPAIVVAATGVVSAWRSADAVVRSSALAGAAAFVTQLVLNPVEGEAFFGTRLTIEPLTFAYPLLVLAWQHRSRRVPSWLAVLALSYTAALHAAGAVIAPFLLVPGGVTAGSVTAVALVAVTAFAVTAFAAHRWPMPAPVPDQATQAPTVSRAEPPR
jgi:hypothetical protein